MEQWLEVIFTDFRTSKKNVNRLVSVGILFVLVGHFYVVERYFQYRTQEHMQKEALREKEQK
jgi:hypothetical protein